MAGSGPLSQPVRGAQESQAEKSGARDAQRHARDNTSWVPDIQVFTIPVFLLNSIT